MQHYRRIPVLFKIGVVMLVKLPNSRTSKFNEIKAASLSERVKEHYIIHL
jgi:hypothetical protein